MREVLSIFLIETIVPYKPPLSVQQSEKSLIKYEIFTAQNIFSARKISVEKPKLKADHKKMYCVYLVTQYFFQNLHDNLKKDLNRYVKVATKLV